MPENHPTTRELQTRLDGMAEAVKLLQAAVDRQPTPALVQSDVDALRTLTGTRIDGLKELIDAKSQGDSRALAAALATRSEATQEIKESFGKQFENQAKLIDALKERIDRGEGRGRGIVDSWGVLVSVAGIIGIIATILATRVH